MGVDQLQHSLQQYNSLANLQRLGSGSQVAQAVQGALDLLRSIQGTGFSSPVPQGGLLPALSGRPQLPHPSACLCHRPSTQPFNLGDLLGRVAAILQQIAQLVQSLGGGQQGGGTPGPITTSPPWEKEFLAWASPFTRNAYAQLKQAGIQLTEQEAIKLGEMSPEQQQAYVQARIAQGGTPVPLPQPLPGPVPLPLPLPGTPGQNPIWDEFARIYQALMGGQQYGPTNPIFSELAKIYQDLNKSVVWGGPGSSGIPSTGGQPTTGGAVVGGGNSVFKELHDSALGSPAMDPIKQGTPPPGNAPTAPLPTGANSIWNELRTAARGDLKPERFNPLTANDADKERMAKAPEFHKKAYEVMLAGGHRPDTAEWNATLHHYKEKYQVAHWAVSRVASRPSDWTPGEIELLKEMTAEDRQQVFSQKEISSEQFGKPAPKRPDLPPPVDPFAKKSGKGDPATTTPAGAPPAKPGTDLITATQAEYLSKLSPEQQAMFRAMVQLNQAAQSGNVDMQSLMGLIQQLAGSLGVGQPVTQQASGAGAGDLVAQAQSQYLSNMSPEQQAMFRLQQAANRQAQAFQFLASNPNLPESVVAQYMSLLSPEQQAQVRQIRQGGAQGANPQMQAIQQLLSMLPPQLREMLQRVFPQLRPPAPPPDPRMQLLQQTLGVLQSMMQLMQRMIDMQRTRSINA